MTKDLYEASSRVTFQDTDITGEMTPVAALLLAQEHAGYHMDSYGMGNLDLKAHGLTWIIARMRMEITKLPNYEDAVVIKTWPGRVHKILYPRYATIEDKNGQEYVRINIVWSIFDYKKRMISFVDGHSLGFPDTKDVPDFMPMPAKLSKEEEQGMSFVDYIPRYRDYDYNGHINNVTYINWVYDALGINFIKEHRLKSLQVDYFEEIVKVEKVSLGLKIKDNKVYAMVKADGKLSTLLELEFTRR